MLAPLIYLASCGFISLHNLFHFRAIVFFLGGALMNPMQGRPGKQRALPQRALSLVPQKWYSATQLQPIAFMNVSILLSLLKI